MENYNHQKIEEKWQDIWEKTGIYHTKDEVRGKENLYHLVMFPYPSGDLHLGHWYNYAGADFRARYMRMKGYNVLSPIGFDAFGLPAENAAIKNKTHPKEWTYSNIEKMRKQLRSIGTIFDWEREVITCDPGYYKWTQWMFLFMYKNGLAYKTKKVANWCPSCNTVIANEQVVGNGVCERCQTQVEQREIDQWMFKITEYADELIDDLEKIDWPEKTKTMQQNWVGRSEGAEVLFKAKDTSGKEHDLWVFTTRPDTLFGATFMVLAPEHPLVTKLATDKQKKAVETYVEKTKKKTELQRMEDEGKEKTGAFTGSYAKNPVNGKEIPIYIADYVLMGYGHGAIMAVPAHDERDWEFAKKFDLPIVEVLAPLFVNNREGEDAFREKDPIKERDAVVALVKHWKEDKYLGVKWTVNDWQGFVIGGIDNGESAAETGAREVTEEIGYKNVKLVTDYGKIIHSKFYQLGKKENRFAHFHPVLYQLEDNERIEVADHEKKLHKEVWLTKNEMSDFVNRDDMQWIWDGVFGGKAYEGEGILVNSEYLNGLSKEEAIKKVIVELSKKKLAKKAINYRLRDWIISRQRYWGAPIPIVYCDKCGEVPVPEEELPVKLPEDVDLKSTGQSPLVTSEKFVNTKCPKCGGKAKRETDTMDTFLCSSWYYFRYTDNKNDKEFAGKEKLTKWLPVDMYVGGAEHSVLHLLYSRFFTKALRDYDKRIDFSEPFTALRHQGTILGEDGQKMSKSLGNVIAPDKEVNRVGADAVRMYIGFMGPYNQGGPWNPNGVTGVKRFLDKVFRLASRNLVEREMDAFEARSVSKTIKKVGEDIPEFKFNTAISSLMVLTNELTDAKEVSREAVRYLLLMLAPFAPHLTEELWERFGNTKSIHLEPWPKYDKKAIEEEMATIVVQVNGKVRANLEMSKNSAQESVLDEAMKSENVKKFLSGKKPKKVIYVKDKILNIVI
ncbi:MAG: class I tRNA ligase family protein [Patescibacteria group bacterium]|nr:class I tRNA ligase family protein [Patescibacteria group bacterium]